MYIFKRPDNGVKIRSRSSQNLNYCIFILLTTWSYLETKIKTPMAFPQKGQELTNLLRMNNTQPLTEKFSSLKSIVKATVHPPEISHDDAGHRLYIFGKLCITIVSIAPEDVLSSQRGTRDNRNRDMKRHQQRDASTRLWKVNVTIKYSQIKCWPRFHHHCPRYFSRLSRLSTLTGCVDENGWWSVNVSTSHHLHIAAKCSEVTLTHSECIER